MKRQEAQKLIAETNRNLSHVNDVKHHIEVSRKTVAEEQRMSPAENDKKNNLIKPKIQ